MIKQELHIHCNKKTKRFYGKWKSGTNYGSHGHTAKQLFMFNLQALETRQVDDSIEAFGNYISFLIHFRRSTVSSENVKKIEKSCIPERSGRSAKA